MHAAGSRLLQLIATGSLLFIGFTNAAGNTVRATRAHLLQVNGMPVQYFISRGTLWHIMDIHIAAFVYHLLDDSSMGDVGAYPSSFTLMGLVQILSTVTLKKQIPCKNMVVGGNYSEQYESIKNIVPQNMYQFLANWRSRIYNFQINSFICGSISSDIVSQSLAYSWSIHVHSRFKVK